MEEELLQRLRGPWGLGRQLTALCNLYVLGSPAVQAFADALMAQGPLEGVQVHRIVSLLQDYLPSDGCWQIDWHPHQADVLPDADDIQGKHLMVQILS